MKISKNIYTNLEKNSEVLPVITIIGNVVLDGAVSLINTKKSRMNTNFYFVDGNFLSVDCVALKAKPSLKNISDFGFLKFIVLLILWIWHISILGKPHVFIDNVFSSKKTKKIIYNFKNGVVDKNHGYICVKTK